MNAQCVELNQSDFESQFLQITEKYLDNYRSTFSEEQESQHISNYVEEVEKIFCFNSVKRFQGQIREIDSLVVEKLTEEASRIRGREIEIDESRYATSRYSLTISNERGNIWVPDHKRFNYTFMFGDNSPQLEKLLKLKRGDDVTFSFKFRERLTREALAIGLKSTFLIDRLRRARGRGSENRGPTTFSIDLLEVEVDGQNTSSDKNNRANRNNWVYELFEVRWDRGQERSAIFQPMPNNTQNFVDEVNVRLEIHPDGTVGRIDSMWRMNPDLEREVMRTLKEWRFSELPSNTLQISQWVTIILSPKPETDPQ